MSIKDKKYWWKVLKNRLLKWNRPKYTQRLNHNWDAFPEEQNEEWTNQ